MSFMHFSPLSHSPTQHAALARRFLILSLLAASVGTAQQAAAAPSIEHSVKVDDRVYEIAFNPETSAVYAAVTGSRDVDEETGQKRVSPGIVALDAQTLEEVDKIATGNTIPFGLDINHATQKLYAVDTQNGQVGVYAIESGDEIALINNPGDESDHLRQIVVDENTNTVYVSAVGGMARGDKPAPKSAIWIIDGDTDTLKSVITDPVKSAAGLALNTDTQRLYVSDLSNNEVAEIDLETHDVLRRFAAVEAPESAEPEAFDTINLEVDAENGILYAINQKSGGVALISLDSGDILRSVKTGAGALSARLHPRSGDLYVANRGDGTVSVVDADSHFVTAHLATGTFPQTIAIDPESGRVYVSNKAKGKGRQAPKDAPTPFEPSGNTVTLITP
ncbi:MULTISPECIES: YncE family protein [unclassified Halomonas]|uniref:YncE family protein n=1 Tax=unclassified Halomonas TaxID=2609666 RepID=UPI004033BF58